MKILFLVPYPLKESPSQRFRFEQYFKLLGQNSIDYHVQSFLESANWKIFFEKGKWLSKVWALAMGFSKRISILLKISNFDYIFIHREAAPVGPPVIEWVIAMLYRKRIIYDFDDAIWLTDRSNESIIWQILKWRKKVKSICRWSHKVSCGNNYLCNFAKQINNNVVLNPTTIDTDGLHNIKRYNQTKPSKVPLLIGWTGSHSTLKYLTEIESILARLENQFSEFEFWVIADRPPGMKLRSLRFKPWSLETEISDLAQIDIGIMPLPDDEWAKGKCGFKALQCMALEIPTIVSQVGVNCEIIQHEVNGFFASNSDEWMTYLEKLILDKELREKIGIKGRETVIDHYSVASNSSTFLSLFE